MARVMLGNNKIVAFIATTDGSRARAFYEGVLGLGFVSDNEFATVFDANGVELRVQKVQELIPHSHTQIGWTVPSIEHIVGALQSKGVKCEFYPFLQQDVLGIWMSPAGAKVAWFKDPDGNIISLTEPPGK